jgi:hypothetical protein
LFPDISTHVTSVAKCAGALEFKAKPNIMQSITRKSPLLLAAFAISIAMAGSASAQWRITRPGSYKLFFNHNVGSGDGIIITASNVTLDLNGFNVSTNARGTGRGIVVENARGVTISGGGVSGFNANVNLTGTQNVRVEDLRITGDGLAPSGGPTEIGIVLVNSWSAYIQNNSISSVNLGIFVRGVRSTGNRISGNIVVGGATAANNLLGICYNPDGGGSPEGPRGDSIYNNHIARFGFALAASAGSVSNIFAENTLASFTGPVSDPQNFAAQDVSNVTLVSAESATSDVLPQLTFLSGLGGVSEPFPFAGGGVLFPELLPGDVLSFSLENVDLAAEGILYQGSVLFGQVPVTDGSGNFTGADFTLTAGAIAEFDNSGPLPLLILPDSGAPGPESITPTTGLIGVSVVPEPSVTLLGVTGLVLFMRRRRSA